MDIDLSTLTAEPIVSPDPPKKVKFAAHIAASIAANAVGSVVASIICQNTTTYSNAQKAKLFIGAYVLSAMVADKAFNYVESTVTPMFVALENFLWIPVEPDLSTDKSETDPAATTKQ